MASSKIFPNIPSADVLAQAGKTPFLDLSWHFSIDLEYLDQHLRSVTPTSATRSDFETYKATEIQKRSAMNLAFTAILTEDEQEFAELQLFTNYTVEMGMQTFSPGALIEHLSRFETLVSRRLVTNKDQLVSDNTTRYIVLAPVLKWHQDERVDNATSKQVVEILERIIGKVSHELLGPKPNADLLEFQNSLIFCYFVSAQALKIGLHPMVICDHLRIFITSTALAWSSIPSKTRMQYATLMLHLVLHFYPAHTPFEEKSGFSRNVLAHLRSVFEDAAGASVSAPFTTHQWVFRWFKDKLDSEIFSHRWENYSPGSLAILSETEQSIAVELSKRFASYRLPVTIHHLERFLLQFGSTGRIRGALRLLTHVKFFPLWEISAAIEAILAGSLSLDPKTHIVVAPFGDQSGSAAIIKYLASHSPLAERINFAENISEALTQTKDGDTLFFVDDCLLSGTQTLNFLGDLMGTRRRKIHHTVHCKALSRNQRAKLLKRSLTFCYSVVTDIGQQRFGENLPKIGIPLENVQLRYGVLDHSSSKAFSPMGPVAWSSNEERESLKEFVSEVGYEILGARSLRKGWDNDRRKQSALGFSDLQRLLVFPYNVPKTTLPVLWEYGNTSRDWQPLFPGFD